MAKINLEEFRKREADRLVTARPHPAAPLLIWNYTPKCQWEAAWDDVTMRARGLITRLDGTIVTRGFRKFFNIGEPLCQLPAEPFEVYDKLDGSLGLLYHIGGRPFIATRGSFESEQAQAANKILTEKYPNAQFDPAFSYLFEIVYPDNRIVVDYGDTEELFLLAKINTATEQEVPCALAGFPSPRKFDFQDIDSILAIQDNENEGFVIRFESGYRAKCKFTEYKRLHKILTQCSSKSIWESLRDGKPLEEILERVPDEFYVWVKNTELGLRQRFIEIESMAHAEFQDLGDRKANALYYKTCKSNPSILFNMLDQKSYAQAIWKMLRPKFAKPFREDEG